MPPSEKKSEDFVERIHGLESADYEAIFDFLDGLRAKGFRFGTHQYFDLHRVLVTLNSQTETGAAKLKTYLAPIVCTTPAEQEIFYSHFDEWLKQRNIIEKKEISELPKTENNQLQQKQAAQRKRILKRVFAYSLLTLFIISTVLLLFSNTVFNLSPYTFTKKVGTIKGQVVDEDNMTPLSGAEILFNKGAEKTDRNGQFTLNYSTRLKKVDIVINYPNYPLKIESVILSDGEQSIQIKIKRPIETVNSEQQVVENVISRQKEQNLNHTAQPTPEKNQVEITAKAATPDYWNQFYRDNFYYLLALTAFTPLLYFCLWWLLRQRRRARLARKETDDRPELNKLIVKGVTEILYQSSALRRTIHELRRHRPKDSNDLNVSATIDATINRGGLPKPIYGTRKTSPEYLILIDRANFGDQQALLKEVLINRLIEEGVYVDRYYFDRDPRFCYKTPKSETLSLPELAARYPEHNLAVFSDGANFLDPLTALPQRWLETFSLWVRRAMLTPASSNSWGYREKILNEADFPVLPANKEGIAALINVVSNGQLPKINLNRHTRQFPEILEERPLRWLDRHAPGQNEIDELYRQLRRYLDAEEFYLLCACAVYPALSLELTLYLGYKLGEEVERLEDELFSLVRLPWFRHDKMPDWLRQRLLSGLSVRQEKEIRAIIEQLLITAIENPQEGIRMEFVVDGENSKSNRRKLKKYILGETEDSPLRDYVFLNFIAHSPLTVAVPEAVRRLLFPEGVHWLGIKPSVILLLVLIISLGATTVAAYFLPTPLDDEVVQPKVVEPEQAILRSEPIFSYSPASGMRGKQYKMRFASKDCNHNKLGNVTLESLEEGGITVLTNQPESECVHNATIEIASDAQLGAQTLILSRDDVTSDGILFTVGDIILQKTRKVTPTPAVSPQPSPGGLKICSNIRIICPNFLTFQPTDSGLTSKISSNGSGIDGAKFDWSIDQSDSTFSIISGQGTSTIEIIAGVGLALVAQEDLKVILKFSENTPECTQVLSCRTKAKFGSSMQIPSPKPTDTSDKNIPKPTVTPTSTEMTGSTPPLSFSVYYQFDNPVKGWRKWQRFGNTSWTETYEDGVVTYFKVIGRLINVFGSDGTLIAKIKGGLGDTDTDGSFQVFIPDIGSKNMTAYFRHNGGDWGSLGEMQNIKSGNFSPAAKK